MGERFCCQQEARKTTLLRLGSGHTVVDAWPDMAVAGGVQAVVAAQHTAHRKACCSFGESRHCEV